MKQQFVTLANGTEITVHQATNNTYGNPRFVVHFLSIADSYDKAISLAKKIGGSRYRAKAFGGGVVFQSFDIKETLEQLMSLAK